jgi:hypothetical protein
LRAQALGVRLLPWRDAIRFATRSVCSYKTPSRLWKRQVFFGPSKRFVSAYCDLLVIAIVDNENVPVLERFFPDEFEPYASR